MRQGFVYSVRRPAVRHHSIAVLVIHWPSAHRFVSRLKSDDSHCMLINGMSATIARSPNQKAPHC